MLDLLCSLIPVMDLLQHVEAAIHVTDPKIDFQKINQILFLMSSEQAGSSQSFSSGRTSLQISKKHQLSPQLHVLQP